MANNFIPFCETDTGTNLLTQGEYATEPQRVIGNQPGIAKSKLVNKAMRQATAITSSYAQFISDTTGQDVLDDANFPKLLAQIKAASMKLAPVYTKYTATGSSTHQNTVVFFVASANATAGAVYSNNSFSFTVKSTIASGTMLYCLASGFPLTSGTLTKTSGTGDTTISFFAARSAAYIEVSLVGGGGGGAGSGNSAISGNNGGQSLFGTSLLTCDPGFGGTTSGGAGGAATIGSGAVGIAISGGHGSGESRAGTTVADMCGAMGAASAFGGAGSGGTFNAAGDAASANSGAGGGSGGVTAGVTNPVTGGGGGAGGFIKAKILSPLATYGVTIGIGGAGGGAGANGFAGGAGGSGVCEVFEIF